MVSRYAGRSLACVLGLAGVGESVNLHRQGPSMNPEIWDYDQMKDMKLPLATMQKTRLKVPNDGDLAEVVIYTFSDVEDKSISKDILKSGLWEPFLVKKLCKLYQSAMVGNFLDVGANLGSETLSLQHCMSGQGEVISVEAVPGIRDRLVASVVANELENVKVVPYAVGDMAMGPTTQFEIDNTYAGMSAVGGFSEHKDATKITVNVTTLDALLDTDEAMQKIMIMKMDIEGSEGHALAGAQRFMQEFRPCHIIIELNPTYLAAAGTPFDDVKSKLEQYGYTVEEFEHDHGPNYLASLSAGEVQSCIHKLRQ